MSVVIAAFDAERTLGEQLAALSRQVVLFPFEVLVCDNGSSDRTIAVAEQWRLGSLPQLRVVDASARRGPGAARNAGAAAALAPLLVFCDADDVVADDWLAEMHSALQTADFVSGTSKRPELNSAPESPVYFDFSTYRRPFFPQLPVAGAGNMGVRAEVFRSVGGFDESLQTGEDLDLCWRVQLSGHRLEWQPTAIVRVSNRETLRASWHQAYAYGVGEKRLGYKYARVIAAFDGLAPLPVAADRREASAPAKGAVPATSPLVSRGVRMVRRVVRKAVSVRRPTDLSNIAFNVGIALGSRFGSVDRSMPQVEPPASPHEVGR
ncbi:MAG: glycosyltransferase [Acidobacteria bacterium]|nr:glycosyltransferase [Acidobacteriota bacterium]